MSDGEKPAGPKRGRKARKKSVRNRSSKSVRAGNKSTRARPNLEPIGPIFDEVAKAAKTQIEADEDEACEAASAAQLEILAAIIAGREPPGPDLTLPPGLPPVARKMALIELVATSGDEVNGAAKALGISRKCVWEWKRDDKNFAAALEYAYHVDGTSHLVSVAVRRAVHGWLEPVYFKGTLSGFKRMFDNGLLMRIIQKRDPAYRDPKWAATAEAPKLPGEVSIDLDKMPPKLRAELRKEAERQAKQREGAAR